MPILYRIEDSAEAIHQGMDPALDEEMSFGDGQPGKLSTGEYHALLLGDEIIPLPHPAETATLRAHNRSYLSASLGGELLQVERRICLQCGHLFDAPRVVFEEGWGCLPGLLAASTVFGYVRLVLGMATVKSFALSWIALMGVTLLLEFAGAIYIRARFSERQASIKRVNCPACDARNSASVSSLAGKRVRLGREGKWIHVSIAGKS